MAAKIEANHAWLESVIYQANNMSEVEFMFGLGGPIAGLKGTFTKNEYVNKKPSQQRLLNSALEKQLRYLVDWHIVAVDKEKK
jgi:hypothetical protein